MYTLLIDKFLKLEDELNLFEEKYDNFSYWIYIRFEIYTKIFQEINRTSPVTLDTPISLLSNIKLKTQLGINILKSIFSILPKNKDILIVKHPRKLYINNFYTDIYTDFLSESFTNDVVYLDCRSPLYCTPQKETFLRNDKAIITRLFYILNSIGKKRKINNITNIQKRFESSFNIKFKPNYFEELIISKYYKYKSLYRYFNNLLIKAKTKIIIEVVYYNFENLILNEVANNLNIPTIELQHGTMGRNHIAYNFSKKINLNQLPRYMFLFSEYWKNNTQLPLLNDYIKITGFPYFENQLKMYNTKKKMKKKKQILFISQTTIGLELSKFATRVLDSIDSDEYQITYKFHPAEQDNWEQRMPWLYKKSEFIRIANNTTPLYQLFAESDILIGVYSTAIYEGLGFNLDTYIVKLPGYEAVLPLIQNKYVKIISHPDELITNLRNPEPNQVKKNISFWKDNAKENVINEISYILKGIDYSHQ